MSEIQTIVIVILQVVFSLPAAFSLLLLFGVGGGMIAGFHEKPSDERAIENWKKVCRIAALPILLCLALIDASVCCFVLRHDLAGGLLMGAAVAEAVALVAIFNKSKKISLLIKMSKDEFWRESE